MTEQRDDGGVFPMPLDLRMRAPSRRYMGLWVGFVTVAVAAAALFCEMHMTAVPVEQTFMTAAVMILCCFIMYTSMFDAGHQRSCTAAAYREKAAQYAAVRERVRSEVGTEGLDGFCTRYIAEELREARERILTAAGESLDGFEAWREAEKPRAYLRALPREKRRALRRAARLSALRLSAGMLMSEGGSAHRQAIPSVRGARVKRTVTALLPTTIGSLITVAVTLEGTAMTPAAMIAGLLRLFTVVWTGVRGYSAGSYAVSEDDAAALDCKITLLGMYCAAEENGAAPEKQGATQ